MKSKKSPATSAKRKSSRTKPATSAASPGKRKTISRFVQNALKTPSILQKRRERESGLQTRILSKLRTEFPGIWIIKVSDMHLSGIPDLIGCWKGRFFAIEVKISGRQPTPLQIYTMDRIKDAGGNAIIGYNVTDCLSFVHGLNDLGDSEE